MKRFSAILLLGLATLTAAAQKENKTLLWKISGNGIENPSYLFGTIHMLCKEDAYLSDNLVKAIKNADRVYLELDMDNLFELLGIMTRMKMKNDTTLADLLTPEEYAITKAYFEKNLSLPFSELERYKPMVASSLLMESSVACDEPVAMETLIMEEARKNGKRIDGLETMAYQMGVFDSIPYKVQAMELYKGIAESGKAETDASQEFKKLMEAYKAQDLDKLSKMISQSDDGMLQYEDILLYNRNRNWVEKLKSLLKEKALVIAVGAGHLPGEKGLINLLRKEGYKLTPVENRAGGTKEI